MTDKIYFQSNELKLEGLFEQADPQKCVIITHPHPLYGGDMYNYVVDSIAKIFRHKGYSTLRFNFRGTGQSQGRFDNGNGEVDDLISAMDYLTGKGFDQIILAGYSFGSWVTALAAQKHKLSNQMFMVSPPVGFLNYDPVKSLPNLKWVASGDLDDFAPLHLVKESVKAWNSEVCLEVIPNTDHFYSGRLDQMEAILSDYLSKNMAS